MNAAESVICHKGRPPLHSRSVCVKTSPASSQTRVKVSLFRSDQEEAGEVVDSIKRLHRDGVPFGDIAVLYRTNDQVCMHCRSMHCRSSNTLG